MKPFLVFTTLILTALFSLAALATGIAPVPEVDLFAKLAELVLNWGSLGSLAKGMIIVAILTQGMKQITDFKYKNLMVVIFSVAYGVLQMMVSDVSLSSAFVTVLVSGGGAVAIYNVAKPFLKSMPFLDFLKLGSK